MGKDEDDLLMTLQIKSQPFQNVIKKVGQKIERRNYIR